MRIVLFDRETAGHHVLWVNYLATYLTEEGHSVKFLTSTLDEETEDRLVEHSGFESSGLSGKEAEGRLSQQFTQLRGLRKALTIADAWDADVIHLLDFNRIEFPTLVSVYTSRSCLTDTALFGTLVTPYFLEREGKPLPTRLYHRANSWALRHLIESENLNGLFVLSPVIRDQLVAEWGVVDESIVNVPDPIEPFDDVLSRAAARQKLGLPDDKPIVLFFGAHRWEKGPDILLDAVHSVDVPCTVVFAGPPDCIDETDVDEITPALPDDVEVVGRFEFIDDENVPAYFRSATLVTLPYRESYDGTSGILQHAAATERPVIATDAGQVGPTVRKWGLGTTVPPEDTDALTSRIECMLRDPPTPDQFREDARSYVDAHHWRKMAAKTLETYLEARE